MHSRSYLLLEQEYEELQEARLHGISVTPISDNLLTWIVQLQGLKDSLWEGAVLQLTMRYSEEYNHHPPRVIFNTIPFHPNVDQTSGKPCIDFLDDPAEWNPAFTMTYILLVIQAMLSNPILENAVNTEAAAMVLNNAALYREMVLSCVKTSRQIEDGTIQESHVIRRTPAPVSIPTPRNINSVSFEDYHKTWHHIGTSQAVPGGKQKQYREQEPRMDVMRTGNNTYNIIIHGLLSDRTRAFPSLREEEDHECALCRLSETHLLESILDIDTSAEIHFQKERHHTDNLVASHHESARDGEPAEEEVDNLVAWTNTLSTELLD
ncbi:ubiquitin-conjugating enzyme E2 U [Dendropsophus ebraccatus]|uniref:ubiquitin-conjugating enzyme E2 U n=1 Tax=Dendropsophus ebraccatus TaxID=150705 RepID=UPI003831B267